ncbi:MAG: coenzyme F420-0:L-glutamate ligase [Nitrososphaerota archaeon]|jgi:F420-0:gamma-glutamyl ligase-like protein|uniref:coenzyme F420-0:L-glutamate ligase n=1 Tax=Candidatus Bathycorpusculum sp. TaxID=2994959 RepID=UPI002839666D|nr:coenzyme F420-0:L-glutamate ligase [Candidatus Termitimicrobium sp.]MCL2431206.1 coenzyme F420-0:L-glutamate ligase [Candidatus Termitimicrobium sp.]MDR0492332.1 coenzyme F420-0:L-glutamate ligase [Nitrososphaerota archaeon]
MPRYSALAVATSYWKPNENYLCKITGALEGKLLDGDFVVVSEKAIAIATGCIVNEALIVPSRNAKFIAKFWMRVVWGYGLGVLCGFGMRLLRRLREYPIESGSRHKQVALEYTGLLDALMFGSEGGIDGSNLAYSYVSLPLYNADIFAQKIHRHIQEELGKDVCVILADTDKTFRFCSFYFTPRPNPMHGIHSLGGVIGYVLGRVLDLKRGSTPLAVAGGFLLAREALTITNIADRVRGPGSGATVWDMASRFHVEVDGVSWEMLDSISHKPLVVVRKKSH